MKHNFQFFLKLFSLLLCRIPTHESVFLQVFCTLSPIFFYFRPSRKEIVTHTSVSHASNSRYVTYRSLRPLHLSIRSKSQMHSIVFILVGSFAVKLMIQGCVWIGLSCDSSCENNRAAMGHWIFIAVLGILTERGGWNFKFCWSWL